MFWGMELGSNWKKGRTIARVLPFCWPRELVTLGIQKERKSHFIWSHSQVEESFSQSL